MCSVVTKLVTSLEFQPIRSATMLCHFGRTRNGYVATRFVLFSSTAESSATSGYVVAPEHFGQSEARAGRNVERFRKSLVLFPLVDLFNAVCKHKNLNLSILDMYFILCNLFIFGAFFNDFHLSKTCLIFRICCYLLCRRGNNHFDVQFWRIGPVLFPSKD